MARPNLRCPTIDAKLEQAFSLGATTLSACFNAGISKTTFYRWCEQDAAYKDRMSALKEKPILKALQTVYDDLSSPQTAKWYLERKHPDFKPKQEVETNTAQEFQSDFMKRITAELKS